MITAPTRFLLLGLLASLAGLFGCGKPSLDLAKPPSAYVVTVPVVNFHSGPGEDSDVVSQALLGARLVPLERKGGWVKVKGDDDYPGWATEAALRGLGEQERYPAGEAVEVDALAANLYREPDLTVHRPVLTVPFGSRLEKVKGGHDTPRWLEVRLPDRRVAWIQNGDLRQGEAPLDIPASLALARRFLGVTYTWGGSSSFGFDCSGFTQTILRRRGLIMPRDAGPQAEWSGVSVVKAVADLQPGDLLFFGKDAAHITHTGMYVGEGTFIHDTTRDHPRVQLSQLGDPDWTRLLVAMRRPK